MRTGEPGAVEAGCLTELVGLVPAASCTLPPCFRDAGLFSHKWFFPASVKYGPSLKLLAVEVGLRCKVSPA